MFQSLFFLFISFFLVIHCEEICKTIPPSEVGPMIPEVPWFFNETYQVIELDPSTGARCLDGSNYKFYFTKGSGSGVNKFMFSWQGGAFCGIDGYDTLESCFYRSKMFLGSSKYWGENGSFVSQNMSVGYFSNMEKYNPDFWNWNKIGINYCDGSNHQGYLEDPLQFNGTNLWFRGFNNTFSVFEYARKNLGLFKATEVIVSGGSAGGQATYIWSDYLKSYFPSSVKLMGIPDAGMFLDVYNNQTECHLFRYLNHRIANLTNSANLELFKGCQFYGTDNVWKCMVAEYILENINIPMFLINSQDDYEAMRTHYGVTCVVDGPETCSNQDKVKISDFRHKFLGIVNNIKKQKPSWGFWLRTCFEHVYQGSWAWYGHTKNVFNGDLGNSSSLRDAMHYWYNGGNIQNASLAHFVDVDDWEHNSNCHFNRTNVFFGRKRDFFLQKQ